jgi:hypothetical protein
LKADTLINLLENKTQIQHLETVALKSVVDEFPYFQSARAIYLKGLKNQDSFKYNNELKVTAAYTTDRTILFDYITSKDFEAKQQDIQSKISEKILTEQKFKEVEIVEEVILKKEEIHTKEEKVENELSIGKPILFSNSENYSFNQWLQISAKKPIQREVSSTKETLKNDEIIDSFILNNPKIAPLSKEKTIAVSVTKNKQDAALMTETLAKVYLEQKKYENAIQAYRILSLKYPEKSGFFADQIKRIQILQKNKL